MLVRDLNEPTHEIVRLLKELYIDNKEVYFLQFPLELTKHNMARIVYESIMESASELQHDYPSQIQRLLEYFEKPDFYEMKVVEKILRNGLFTDFILKYLQHLSSKEKSIADKTGISEEYLEKYFGDKIGTSTSMKLLRQLGIKNKIITLHTKPKGIEKEDTNALEDYNSKYPHSINKDKDPEVIEVPLDYSSEPDTEWLKTLSFISWKEGPDRISFGKQEGDVFRFHLPDTGYAFYPSIRGNEENLKAGLEYIKERIDKVRAVTPLRFFQRIKNKLK